MSKPLFSVILPTHNGSATIEQAIRSVMTQSFMGIELLIILDDCDEATNNLVYEWRKKFPGKIKPIPATVHRDGLARNIALNNASGEWILFLDDDDEFTETSAFELLAQTVKYHICDAVFFDFIIKDQGVYHQTPNNCFTGSAGHLWKREFIGDTRFSDAEYGSDSQFARDLILKEPTVKFVDIPLYFYNYMREGSLTWKHNKAYLDIIITHWNEQWSVGKKLFDSIQLQECVDLNKVHFIIVQDGKDTTLPWNELLSQYSFNVSIVFVDKHSGVANARNTGIEHATSDWIMFMDFDDILADVATLSQLLRVFPVDSGIDIIWSQYVREVADYVKKTDTAFNCERECDYRMIGKLYRRQFLNDHNIRFIDDCPEYCDMIFNEIAWSETYPHKIMNFYAPFFPFYKKYRSDGAFSSLNTMYDKMMNRFKRDRIITLEMFTRNKEYKRNEWIARAIIDAYMEIKEADTETAPIPDEVFYFWGQYKDIYNGISPNDIEAIIEIAETESMAYIQDFYNHFRKEYCFSHDDITLEDFTHCLNSPATAPETIIISEPEEIDPPQEYDHMTMFKAKNNIGVREPRVVVYCGTKNVYINMIASAKSLLATTPVDKVYFLTEDDTFPYEIPDIIETINVSNIHPFTEDGPNYNNVWTYMCLMRTTFPLMFSQYDKILSLDVDVVITEDVSNLWDIDLTDYYYAGVPEQGRENFSGSDIYANFGVIMMNLKKLREDKMHDRLVKAVNTEHFTCPEQDAFNKYCRGKIYQLPNDYNVTVYSHITGEALHERILHYAGMKYWKHFAPVKKYFNLEWDEIMSMQNKLKGVEPNA